jgi:predicted component of type VI protein secretion system
MIRRAAGVGMDDEETEIGGSNGRRVQKRAARGSRKAKPKRRGFTEAKRRKFLNHFAATANAKASARVAGISHVTVYAWRCKNEQFRADFYEALAQGYVDVEAELVRESKRSLKPTPDRKAPPLVDARTALAVLESYRRNGNRRPGDILPQRTDIEQVRARLEKVMRAMGLIGDQHENPDNRAGRA